MHSSGCKCVTYGGVRRQLSESQACFEVLEQLWTWHLLTVADAKETNRPAINKPEAEALNCTPEVLETSTPNPPFAKTADRNLLQSFVLAGQLLNSWTASSRTLAQRLAAKGRLHHPAPLPKAKGVEGDAAAKNSIHAEK